MSTFVKHSIQQSERSVRGGVPAKAKTQAHVLVIDDSDIARAAIAGMLEDEFEVFDQPSAIGATRAIREHNIRAVVVDISMPGLSGDKLLGVLRKNQRLNGLVVVVVSARSTEELEAMTELSAADAVLSKDGLDQALARTLTRLLRASNFQPSGHFVMAEEK